MLRSRLHGRFCERKTVTQPLRLGLPTVAPNLNVEGVHRRLAQLLGQAMVDNLRLDHGAEVGGPRVS